MLRTAIEVRSQNLPGIVVVTTIFTLLFFIPAFLVYVLDRKLPEEERTYTPGTVFGGSAFVAISTAAMATAFVVLINLGGETAESRAASQSCHPSYEGACLDPGASDYDCAGGPGDGPRYSGEVRVIGFDEYGLDGDGNGIGCEPYP